MSTEKQTLRNLMVLALLDGQLADEEKDLIRRLREELGVEDEEFRRICQEVRENPRRMSLPEDPTEIERMFGLLLETARADGQLDEQELALLRRVAEKAGLGPDTVDRALDATDAAADDAGIQQQVEELYENWADWSEQQRREKVDALASRGRPAVMPLLRVLESYRTPDGADDALSLKVLVAEKLGELRDERAAYYLSQQVNLGDGEDEVSCSELRYAAAEALGRITGEDFSRDQQGVRDVRQWWQHTGRNEHTQLAM